MILYKIVSGAFADLATSSAWRWEPSFVSLSNGDLNGDGDDEVVMLRDPTRANTSLLMVNPVGASMPSFEQSTGYGSAAFRIVRNGDTDGDGKDEIVILKGDRDGLDYQPDAAVPSDRVCMEVARPLLYLRQRQQLAILGARQRSMALAFPQGHRSVSRPSP